MSRTHRVAPPRHSIDGGRGIALLHQPAGERAAEQPAHVRLDGAGGAARGVEDALVALLTDARLDQNR